MKKQWYLCLVLAVLCFTCTAAFYDWSHQQTLFVPNTRPTYGLTTPLLVGRGFQTLVTGYDPVSPGIFVHTTDDGFVQNSHVVWSQQKVLKPSEDLLATDLFGKIMVSFNQTLIVAAPNRANRRGGVYVFNGTKRHWSQIQRITAPETTEGDLFGDSMALHNDRLIIGAKGQSMNGGAAYVYERPSGGLYWSRTARLLPRDQRKDGYFAEKVSLYENTVAVSAHNDNPGDSFTSDDEFTYDTGSAYIFTGVCTTMLTNIFSGVLLYQVVLYFTVRSIKSTSSCFSRIFLTIHFDWQHNACGVTLTFYDVLYHTCSGSTGTWSQQQKLVANEFLFYERGGAFREVLYVLYALRMYCLCIVCDV